jgi:hypothetical protein
LSVTLDDIKAVFGQGVRVVSPVRCWDMETKTEIIPPLGDPIASLIERSIAFRVTGLPTVICSNQKALEAARGDRKVLLEDCIDVKTPGFDRSLSLMDWSDPKGE